MTKISASRAVTILATLVLVAGCRSSIVASSNQSALADDTGITTISGSVREDALALAAAQCEETVVSLHDARDFIDAWNRGSEPHPVAESFADAGGNFVFESDSLTRFEPTKLHVIAATRCGHVATRILSGPSEQHLSAQSTALTASLELTHDALPVPNPELFRSLELLNSPDGLAAGTDIVQAISSSEALHAAYLKSFGVDVGMLERVAPFIIGFRAPFTVTEGSELAASAQTFHWNRSAKVAYRWELADVVVGTQQELKHRLEANDQGTKELRLVVGIADAGGAIAINAPTRTISAKIEVVDKLTAAVPKASVVSDLPQVAVPVATNSAIEVLVITGKNRQQCATFSRLAITESDIKPGESAFVYACKRPDRQTLSYNLRDGTNGPRSLYLWTIDASGRISGKGRALNFFYEPTPPAAAVIGWPAGHSNVVAASGTVTGLMLTAYRYKLGAAIATDCGIDVGYSAWTDTTSPITADLTSAPDGPLALCLLGKRASGYEQKPSAATVVNWTKDVVAPTATISPSIDAVNNAVVITRSVGGTGVTGYRYKFGEAATTDCSVVAGYASEQPIATQLNANVTSLADGNVVLCLIGRDAAGNWQSPSAASVISWYKNTATPTATLSGAPTGESAVTTLGITVAGADVTEYVYKIGLAATTDCTISAGYGAPISTVSLVTDDVSGIADGVLRLCVLGRDALGNEQVRAGATQASWTKDTTPPGAFTLSLPTQPTQDVTPAVTWSAAAGADVYDLVISTAADCSVTTAAQDDIATLGWTPAALADGTYYVCASARDTAGNITTAANDGAALVIDTTPPGAFAAIAPNGLTSDDQPTVTWNAAAGAATYTLSLDSNADCAAPFAWSQAGVVGTSQVPSTLADGTYYVCLSAIDSAGNTRTASTNGSLNFAVDDTAPTIAFPAIAPRRAGATTINWLLTEAHAGSAQSYTVELSEDGATWTNLGSPTLGANGPFSGSTRSATVTLPAWDTATARVRISYSDLAGNAASATSALFTIDSTSPDLLTFDLAGGASIVTLPSVAAATTVSDALSGVTHIRFSESATYADDGWIAYASPTTATISKVNGTKTVHAWVKDAAGNVSSSLADTLTLDFGNPPTARFVQPASGSTFAGGAPVTIEWECAATNGLATPPIEELAYTSDDGATFTAIATNLPNNLSATTGSFSWTLPAPLASTAFRLRIKCKSLAGMVSPANSGFINTPGWTLYAGDAWDGKTDVAALVADVGGSQGAYQQSVAIDARNNIYYVKDTRAIMKVDAVTSMASVYAGGFDSSACTMTTGSNLLTGRWGTPTIMGTRNDGNDLLVYACQKIFAIDTATATISIVKDLSGFSGFAIIKSHLAADGTLIFYANQRYYSLDLTSTNAPATVIFGDGTCVAASSISTGTLAASSPIPLTSFGACPAHDIGMFATPDRSSIWIAPYANGVWRLDWNGTAYVIGSKSVAGTTLDYRGGCVYVSTLPDKVFCRNRVTGRDIYVIDLPTVTSTTVSVPTDADDDGSYLSLGTRDDLLAVHYSGGTIHLTSPRFPGSWDFTKVAGQALNTFGNGGPLSAVAFGIPIDLVYGTASNKLYVVNSGHNRVIDFSTPARTVSTLFGASRVTASMTTPFRQDESAFAAPTSCGTYRSIHKYAFTSTTTGTLSAGRFLSAASGCGSGAGALYPPPPGTSLAIEAGRLSHLQASGRARMVYRNDDTLFFPGINGTNDAFVFSSNGSVINRIAGRTGPRGYDPADHNNPAVNAQLYGVSHIQRDANGDLLIWDGTWRRRITIATNPGSPLIQDVENYATSAESWHDVYFDQATNTTYYVDGVGPSVKKINAGTTSTYNMAGAGLSGNLRIALTPDGLLILHTDKRRIYRVDP